MEMARRSVSVDRIMCNCVGLCDPSFCPQPVGTSLFGRIPHRFQWSSARLPIARPTIVLVTTNNAETGFALPRAEFDVRNVAIVHRSARICMGDLPVGGFEFNALLTCGHPHTRVSLPHSSKGKYPTPSIY